MNISKQHLKPSCLREKAATNKKENYQQCADGNPGKEYAWILHVLIERSISDHFSSLMSLNMWAMERNSFSAGDRTTAAWMSSATVGRGSLDAPSRSRLQLRRVRAYSAVVATATKAGRLRPTTSFIPLPKARP